MQTTRKTILEDTPLSTHLQAYKNNNEIYVSTVKEIFANDDLCRSIVHTNKGRIAATLLHNLQNLPKEFDLPEVLQGCQILDSRRLVKQMIKKLADIDIKLFCNFSKVQTKKLKHKRKHINDLKINSEILSENVPNLSLTLARIKIVHRWVKQLSEQSLLFRSLLFDCKPWKKLADLCHFNPKIFYLNWFLKYCFNGKAPVDSILYKIKTGNQNSLIELYKQQTIPYEYLRNNCTITPTMKRLIASQENLRTVLWYHDEIGQDDIIVSRLQNDPNVNLPYGKLVDIIMAKQNCKLRDLLINIAQNKLKNYKINLPSPIAIFCDASYSMDIAIKTSAILSSLLCVMTNAELSVFQNKNQRINDPPHDVASSLMFAQLTKANFSTCPASSLMPYLEQKREVQSIIIITDQEENTRIDETNCSNNFNLPGYFAHTFNRYTQEVYPARLVFITFGDNNSMIKRLINVMGESYVKEMVTDYNFSKNEPDLRKLDAILEKMC